MGSEAYLFQGGVNGGNAIASGAQQYMENRKQSQALDGSLDRMGSMLASFAEQHPGSITAADQRLIDQIAKAPGQGLAQKKAAYADGMTWLKMKSDEVNDASLARYHDAQAVNMERTYQAGLAKAAEEKDTREAQRFMLNPETKFRKNSLGWPEEVGPDARLAEALDKYPNANPPDVQKVVKDQDTGWQLKKGEIITFEDGSKGYPTSQNSMVIKNPNFDGGPMLAERAKDDTGTDMGGWWVRPESDPKAPRKFIRDGASFAELFLRGTETVTNGASGGAGGGSLWEDFSGGKWKQR